MLILSQEEGVRKGCTMQFAGGLGTVVFVTVPSPRRFSFVAARAEDQ